MFVQREYQSAAQGLPLPRDTWLPDLQVMTARDKEGSTDGFFLAAKGGSNEGAHSHNDIGSFVVYYNGFPLLIDVGSGTYTRRTFSSKRYEIWSNRSAYHNVPTINGQEQLHGARYQARDVVYRGEDDRAALTLDLAMAYPESAGVRHWTRYISLQRGREVRIEDAVELSEEKTVTEHLITCYPAEMVQPGKVVIRYAPKEAKALDFAIEYDPARFDVAVEKIKLGTREDRGIQRNWGDGLHRINFQAKTPRNADQYRWRIVPLPGDRP